MKYSLHLKIGVSTLVQRILGRREYYMIDSDGKINIFITKPSIGKQLNS